VRIRFVGTVSILQFVRPMSTDLGELDAGVWSAERDEGDTSRLPFVEQQNKMPQVPAETIRHQHTTGAARCRF